MLINAIKRVSTKLYVLGAPLLICYLSGCVAGQSIKLDYLPEADKKIISTNKIAVEVNDDRPYVKSGEKSPSYIGHYRATFGNTWDVTTKGKTGLAEGLQDDLIKELTSLGLQTAKLSGDRLLKVSIQEYNFDTYMNGKHWYTINVKVLDANNNILADTTINDEVVIKGSVWVGPKYAVQKEVPKIYQSIIKKIVRENDKILAVLK